MMKTQDMRGFTLIETMVAVSLLAITIVLPYYAIQRSLIATYNARDELIASALAQEAIEYVRGVRDSNYLYELNNGSISRSWLYGVDGTNSSPNCLTNNCQLDASRNTPVTICPTLGCTAKLYLSTTNLYNQTSSGTQTKFVRYIRLKGTGTTGEVSVTAVVTWESHGTQVVTISEVLRDWL